MRLPDYLRLLAHRWLLITGCAVLGIVMAAAVTVSMTPRYATSITLYVSSTDRTPTASTAYDATLVAQERVQSYADLLGSQRVASELSGRLHGRVKPAEVQAAVAASVVPQTALLRATVTDDSPSRARLIASALGPVFSGVVDTVERPASGGPSPVRVTVIDDALTPAGRVSPKPERNLLLGLIVGLLVGAAAAVLRETADTTVKSAEALRDVTGAAVLATVATQDTAQREALREHRSPKAEAYRSLRTNLQYVDVDSPVRVLTVTSSIAGEGKSLTACNLALALADAGKRVVLVDGDLRRPQIGEYLGLSRYTGLTSVLVGSVRLEQALVASKHRLLSVLPSGPIPPNPSELLGSTRMLELIERLQREADVVVIDSPPLLPVTDAAILARAGDGALLVAQYGLTRREHLARAVEQLDAVGARLLGGILNKTPSRGPMARPYVYYGYAPIVPGALSADGQGRDSLSRQPR